MADPFEPRFVDLVRNLTTTTGTADLVLGAAVNGFTSFVDAVLPGERFYYSVIGIDKPAEREIGRGTLQVGGTIVREPISGILTDFSVGTKTVALVAAAEWFNAVQTAAGSDGSGHAAQAAASAADAEAASVDAAASAAAAQSSATSAIASGAAAEAAEAGAVAAKDIAVTAAALPNASVPVVTRSALSELATTSFAAVLTEPGRGGTFVFDSSNLSAKISADPLQGIHVAPAADMSGASGAWVRKFDGAVNVRWFGAAGDDITDDGPAFLAALAHLKSIALGGFGYGVGSPRLFIPAGRYFLGTTTLDLTSTLIIEGDGVGDAGGAATVLRWSAGATGIRVQAHNTQGATGVKASSFTDRGDASIIRNLALKGGYSGTEGEYHGIQLRARASIRDCTISGFEGDGIHIAAGVGTSVEGNANNFDINKVWVDSCRDGIYVDGPDANAGTVWAASVNHNRRWGIWDSSFLGNMYFGCHASGNGWDGAQFSIATGTSYNGKRYAVIPGEEDWCSTNAPTGTTADNQGWRYVGEGGLYHGVPLWESGTTFRPGGAYYTDSFNASTMFLGCYSESDQNPAVFSSTTAATGGTHAAGVSGGLNYGAAFSKLRIAGGLETSGSALLRGATAEIGPITGSSNGTLAVNNASGFSEIQFASYSGGYQLDANIYSQRNGSLVVGGVGGVTLRYNASAVASVTSAGLDIATGKALLVGSTTIIGGDGVLQAAGFPALTGDVTSSAGSLSTAIAGHSVTYSKLQQVAGSSLMGNPTGSPADAQAISIGAGLAFSGSTLVATGSGGGMSWVKLSVDEGGTSSNSAWTSSSLTFEASANTTYVVDFVGTFQTAATTTGMPVVLDIPSGTVRGSAYHASSATASQITIQEADAAYVVQPGNARAANVPLGMDGKWIVEIGATGGAVTLVYRSEVTGSQVQLLKPSALGYQAL